MVKVKRKFTYIELVLLIFAVLVVFTLILQGNKFFDRHQIRVERTEQMAYFSKNIMESLKSVPLEDIPLQNNDYSATVNINKKIELYSKVTITVSDKMGMAKEYLLVSYIPNTDLIGR